MIKVKVVGCVTGKTDNNAPSDQPFLYMHLFFSVQLSQTQPFVCMLILSKYIILIWNRAKASKIAHTWGIIYLQTSTFGTNTQHIYPITFGTYSNNPLFFCLKLDDTKCQRPKGLNMGSLCQ